MRTNAQPDFTIRTPDFHDTEALTVAWIGQDCSIEVPYDRIADVEKIAYMSGQYARGGQTPANFSVLCDTYGITFTHPMHSRRYTPGHRRTLSEAEVIVNSLWAAFRETLGFEPLVMIAAEIDEDAPAKSVRHQHRVAVSA